jgi:hypothetical protein
VVFFGRFGVSLAPYSVTEILLNPSFSPKSGIRLPFRVFDSPSTPAVIRPRNQTSENKVEKSGIKD